MSIVKEVSNVTIEFAENGFIVDYSGRDESGDWKSAKVIFNDFDSLSKHLSYVSTELSEYK